MKANTDKSHLQLSGKNNLIANIDGNVTESDDNQVLIGIILILTSHLINILTIYVKKLAQS